MDGGVKVRNGCVVRLFLFEVPRGFGPGRRVPFVSAKGTKTIAAPAGFLGGEGRQPCEERPNSLRSNTGRKG